MNNWAPNAVYLLCLATSVTCAVLLARAYAAQRTRLLLWVALSFTALAVNNLLLFADLVLLPEIDLWLVRQATSALAVGLLLYGFIWEADR